MNFRISIRDGPGRKGKFEIKNKSIITPNILFINTDRFPAPKFTDLTISNINKKASSLNIDFSQKLMIEKYDKKEYDRYINVLDEKDIVTNNIKNIDAKLFIILNAKQLFDQSKIFLESLIKLRQNIGYQKVIYIPSIGLPSNLSILTYLGVDLFDSTSAIVSARNNELLFENGIFNLNNLEELPCNCPICSKLNKKPHELNFQEILHHNYYSMITEIKHVRNAISKGELRNHVENRVRSSPHHTEILRNLDNKFYDFLEKRTSISSKGKINATTKESADRPEIIRFQRRIINRYKKPRTAKVLLLLPCSAKKPYSYSKSHKKFREQIINLKNPNIVHEVIITSPLGIVPSELEIIYPASSYDIPVTGVWEEYEKNMINLLLSDFLKKNKYDKIVIHLPEEIIDFILPNFKDAVITTKGHTTSRESLENLHSKLKVIVEDFKYVKRQEKMFEEIRSIAIFQFGKEIASKLLKNTTIKGRYPNRKIFERNTQMGMITEERGLISLTFKGAEKISETKNYSVEIYDGFELIGSVFAPGIKDADDLIRIGDEVIVKRNKKLIAVGVAQMNGEEMIESTYGEAIKIRHRL